MAGVLAAGAMLGATQSERLTPERVYAAPDLSGPRARGVGLSPDGTMALYDTYDTERYMGTPTSRLAPNSVLLIHGMADDNVIFENATRLMAALQARSTPFESMLYPGLRHRAGWTQANLLHRTRTSLEYLTRKLRPTPSP